MHEARQVHPRHPYPDREEQVTTWNEYHEFKRRGIRKEHTYDVTPSPERLFDAEAPEVPASMRGGDWTSTTATTHDRATGRSMHYPKSRNA